MKKYTQAIDMSYFSPTHLGGKDETAFNLLRGFEEMGVSKDIICLCSKNMVDVLKQYAPSVHTYTVPQLYFHGFKIKGMNRANRIIRSRYVKYWIEKNKNIPGLWRLVPFCLLMRIMVRMRVSVI